MNQMYLYLALCGCVAILGDGREMVQITFVLDQYLIDVNPMVFVNWDSKNDQFMNNLVNMKGTFTFIKSRLDSDRCYIGRPPWMKQGHKRPGFRTVSEKACWDIPIHDDVRVYAAVACTWWYCRDIWKQKNVHLGNAQNNSGLFH